MTDRIRVGVAGAGHWARTAHLPSLAAHPAAELVALADPDPVNLDRVRDIVSSGNLPRITTLTGSASDHTGPTAVNLGHAAFEFIEAEYGKAGIWQFLNEIRRSVVDGSGDVYPTAFNRTPEEFDSAFAQYLRRRFNL